MNEQCTNCGMCKQITKDYNYDEIIDLNDEEEDVILINE